MHGFQYISCYGLSFTKGSSTISIAISIHPMLRFIADLKICMILLKLISIHPMLRFIDILRTYMKEYIEFQYIPCYGLSGLLLLQSDQTIAFQYIPCYGLSKPPYFFTVDTFYFNTSHVTVYPLRRSGYSSRSNYFNTSHVTVYLKTESRINRGK